MSAKRKALPKRAPVTEEITWFPLPGPDMPDDDTLVLLEFESQQHSEPVWIGCHDGDYGWLSVEGNSLHPGPVAWAHMPKGSLPSNRNQP